ncbi:hypothetical protein [Halopiger xanaduensis]|uniref:Uncharacterized protein n=1 Tax=Halopiger xanaduensis (strain DSM 18323 / JCM 14033 / SH-6) TaxID=797210 RepID=F8D615_HALXS|nr:hypothetical protein [Halopiger xanaduensis]AEH38875.1 hypothetical protein Halxa_4273 [Halopiger xanaduensis SH-6]
MGLTAFGLEPQDSAPDEGNEADDVDKRVWCECVDCGYVGYEVQVRRESGVPLCPSCFTDREGLR